MVDRDDSFSPVLARGFVDGTFLPDIKTPPPGPVSRAWVERLAKTECPAITARRARRTHESGVSQDPIVWESAVGANVRDVDSNVYVDITAAFAVAGIGHRHPRVVEAIEEQSQRLLHAMGDVYPSDTKIAFTERLAEVTPDGLEESILGLSGADAVTAALKTAVVHTGKPGIIAFWGGYHGLSYGALAPTGYRSSFRLPFLAQMNAHVHFAPYPDPYRPPFGMPRGEPERVRDAVLSHVDSMLANPASGVSGIGAMVVEPILGRGGEVAPPDGFLKGLREICDTHGVTLIFDEILTGFARTGDLFACEHEGVTPDLMCVGKAMGGGFPLSAAIGTREVMGSWGNSQGEAIHTSTFLGNPLGCAMGLAAIDVLVEEKWASRNRIRGQSMLEDLRAMQSRFPEVIGDVRGRGLMIGVDLVEDADPSKPNTTLALGLVDAMRRRGYLLLPSGVNGNVLGLTPPFVLTDEQWQRFIEALEKEVVKARSSM